MTTLLRLKIWTHDQRVVNLRIFEEGLIDFLRIYMNMSRE